MLQVRNPFDQTEIKKIPLNTKADIEAALDTAHHLFLNQDQWLPPYQRIEILERVVELMKSRIDDLTILAASEGGKPYQDSKVEVLRAINGVKLAAEHIGQLKGEQVPMGLTKASEGRIAFTTREPIGVVVSVSAFNHPLNLIIHQTVTAIAAGCPVIIKPASSTPLSCLNFISILHEAGLPKGWCQPIICSRENSELLVTDNRVNYFSFIGSSTVGWRLKSKLSPGTRCALEHGGVAPVIIEPDADIQELIPAIIKGGFYHAGQVCVSVQKVFIHSSIAETVIHELIEKTQSLVVGAALDKNTDVGPLINPKEVDRVETWVKESVAEGGEILIGGKRLSDTCFEPTLILNPPQNSKVSKEEVFGPVICIYTYNNRQEAIKIANGLDVHFQASIFTKNIDVALESVKALNASSVMVNDHTAFRVDWMPFGGRDASGIGIGGIQYSMHEMTREKLMVIKSKSI